jgi:phosphatidylserine/phosphatidylglycerophosphate/cardiolipin synthase-like enzyme
MMTKPGLIHRRIARLLLLAGILLALGIGFAFRMRPESAIAEAPALAPGALMLLFSRPYAAQGKYSGGPDEYLVLAIDDAACCVDVAVYDLNLPDVARALIRALHRGVKVRIVMDTDNDHGEAVEMLRGAGVPIAGDQRTALMHDKFVVLDHNQVWAGSMNLTSNDAYLNDNNFFRILSPELAVPFEREFDEMFTRHIFGSGAAGESGAPVLLEGGCSVQPLFAPDDSPAGAVIGRLLAAQRSIHLMAFSFTSQEIAAAVQAAAQRGVEVKGVVERTQAASNAGAQYKPLRDAGLNMLLDGNPRNMHHKVMVLDGQTVIAGSYNFTASAEHNNDEDLLIFVCPPAAAAFETEFRRVYALGNPDDILEHP